MKRRDPGSCSNLGMQALKRMLWRQVEEQRVDAVLAVRIQRSVEKLRVTVRLLRVVDGRQLCAANLTKNSQTFSCSRIPSPFGFGYWALWRALTEQGRYDEAIAAFPGVRQRGATRSAIGVLVSRNTTPPS